MVLMCERCHRVFGKNDVDKPTTKDLKNTTVTVDYKPGKEAGGKQVIKRMLCPECRDKLCWNISKYLYAKVEEFV